MSAASRPSVVSLPAVMPEFIKVNRPDNPWRVRCALGWTLTQTFDCYAHRSHCRRKCIALALWKIWGKPGITC